MNRVITQVSSGADISIIEAAMGLYDGYDVRGSRSSAQVAKQTKTPVVLVLDVTRMTRTAAAIVLGCMSFDSDVDIRGVIVNRVKGARHERLIREAIETSCGIKVIGAVAESPDLAIADRHLGLVTSAEIFERERLLNQVAHIIEESVDLDGFLAIAHEAGDLPLYQDVSGGSQCDKASREGKAPSLNNGSSCLSSPASPENTSACSVKIAIVKDQAFHFYYPENIEALEDAGAELIYVDSLVDAALPHDIDGVYIGGGFPESFAHELEENITFRESIRDFAQHGGVVYAECGGLMYLANCLHNGESAYEMAGVFECEAHMETKRQGHGYAEVVATRDHPWMKEGSVLRGHEHHHSRLEGLTEDQHFGFSNKRGAGIVEGKDGMAFLNTVGGYFHVNAIASPDWADSFVRAAQSYREARKQHIG